MNPIPLTPSLAFIGQDFVLGHPTQSLLDRLLIGYSHAGSYVDTTQRRCAAAFPRTVSGRTDLDRRAQDFKLQLASSPAEAVTRATGTVVAWHHSAAPDDALVEQTLTTQPANTGCFVLGPLASSALAAQQLRQRAHSRGIALAAGVASTYAFRLPDIDVPEKSVVREALIVTQGPPGTAELDALGALLPLLERRRGGESGVARLRHLDGLAVWDAGGADHWSWDLLAAAVSRSDTPQGDPVKDGRLQDIVGLGLVPGLAREPRGWLLDHHDGVRSAILHLDGAIADLCAAVRLASGQIIALQFFRPPSPNLPHYDGLAAAIDRFLASGTRPGPEPRDVLLAELMRLIRDPASRSGQWIAPSLPS